MAYGDRKCKLSYLHDTNNIYIAIAPFWICVMCVCALRSIWRIFHFHFSSFNFRVMKRNSMQTNNAFVRWIMIFHCIFFQIVKCKGTESVEGEGKTRELLLSTRVSLRMWSDMDFATYVQTTRDGERGVYGLGWGWSESYSVIFCVCNFPD